MDATKTEAFLMKDTKMVRKPALRGVRADSSPEKVTRDKYGSDGTSSGSNNELSSHFFDAAHNVNQHGLDGVDLRHPRDGVSHATIKHQPNSKEDASLFHTQHEIHDSRNKWLEENLETMRKSNSERFFRTIEHNGSSYKFGFEKNGEKWSEITGYPRGRR